MFDQTTPNGQPINGGFGAPVGGYYQNPAYNQQMIPKVMNVLTADEIKQLQAQRSQFSLGLTEKEALQSACNHRAVDGMADSLSFDQATGKAVCQICGYEFRPIEPDVSYETIKDASDRIVDILQTIKIMYTDIPGNAAREYFQIIPLIAKVPQLFEFAAKSYNKHEFDRMSYQNRNMGGIAMLQNLNSMFGAPQMQAPQYNPYVAAPQQPVGYPTAAPVGGNPFGYPGAAPQQNVGYQPQVQGYAYAPNQGQPAPTVAAPVAPATEAPAETTVTETVNV